MRRAVHGTANIFKFGANSKDPSESLRLAGLESQTSASELTAASDPSAPLTLDVGRDEEAAEAERLQAATVAKKVYRHVLSKQVLVAFLCYIDRSSISFAAPQLTQQLGFSTADYGFGAGIFFVGYTCLQVPSNMVLVPSNMVLLRLGARRWIGSLVVAWGGVAAACAFLTRPWHFYLLRFCLGCTEAGTMPGMWYHCNLFFSATEMTEAFSWVIIGITLSQVLGAPLASGLLALGGTGGLQGWQWLFLAEGLPSVAVGAFILLTLHDSPLKASFLTASEAEWLNKRQVAAAEAASTPEGGELSAVLKDRRLWHIAAMTVFGNIPKFGIIFFCPLLLQQLLGGQASASLLAGLTTAPFCLSAAFVWLNSRHSRATGERRLHVAVPLFMAAVALAALAASMQLHAPKSAFCALMAAVLVWAPDAVMASWPATFLQGKAAANGVAAINSIGSIGGFIGPYLLGALQGGGSGFALPMWMLSAAALMVAILAFTFHVEDRGASRPSSGSNDEDRQKLVSEA